jgi:hypothetical protein
VPVEIAYDKAIWSGLSWAVGEVECAPLKSGAPLVIQCESKDARPLTLQGAVYQVGALSLHRPTSPATLTR